MPFQNIICSRGTIVYLAVIVSLLYSNETLHAQDRPEQRSYTAPREQQEWVLLGNTATTKCEYDRRTLLKLDSLHFRIRIREIPLQHDYYDITVTKMWEQRSIQGYSDSLQLHPKFYYEGYERYGYTIREELIDLTRMKYSILAAADYDLAGLLLAQRDGDLEGEKPANAESAESMAIDLVSKHKSPILIKN